MITIIDYQMGNLRSVQKALERVGAKATISEDPKVIATSEKVILPGVGAFADAMSALKERGLDEVICDFVATGKPFLGICLGLQLLFDVSYEGGTHAGLGIVPGEVRRFPPAKNFKVPHMGWNQLAIRKPKPLLAGIPDESYFYFVHSYYVAPTDPSCIAAATDYNGEFCSVLQQDNLFATQFHPEKSQKHGLMLLDNFANLV